MTQSWTSAEDGGSYGGEPTTSTQDPWIVTPEPVDTQPDSVDWALAVILGVLLIGGLIKVVRVLRKGPSVIVRRPPPEGMRSVQCGCCFNPQYIPSNGRIFVCFSCCTANRVPVVSSNVDMSVLTPATGPLRRFAFKREGENFYQEIERSELPEVPLAAPDSNVHTVVIGRQENDGIDVAKQLSNQGPLGCLPACVVCLDKPGNMVMLPCAHGGVCEECATRIAQNRSYGGAHCPHCRRGLDMLVKLEEMDDRVAKGIEHRIPIARVSNFSDAALRFLHE
mmetsp:Transcript_23219/g.51351  ORF Transcript_23219/g.51351 Transcript_23219/m.51351 type:complete len:280 (-) Transcript_23219:79-918(-)